MNLPIITGLEVPPKITPEVREWLDAISDRLWTPDHLRADLPVQYECKIFSYKRITRVGPSSYVVEDLMDTPPRGGSAP